jgi:GNAT superfamily N-acetyltransferase
MEKFTIFSPESPLSEVQVDCLADFLVSGLAEYGDPKTEVIKCLNFAMEGTKGPGGLVITLGEFSDLKAALVVNHTGMSGYIPEHILVYFVVSQTRRGKGLGQRMLEYLMTKLEGGIALHVEPGNPAIRLYEKLGFVNNYLEMRRSR